jgi:hypothetical protein
MQTRFVPLALIAAIVAAAALTFFDFAYLTAEQRLEEDGLTESVTALMFLLATLAAGVAIRTAVSRQARIVAGLIGASALIAFLSEVSFGQRTATFEYEAPLLRGTPIDAAHDLVSVGYVLLRDEYSGAGFWGIVAALVGGAALLLWLMRRIIRNLDEHAVALRYFACGCALVLTALVVDLDFATGDVVYVIEEMIELDAALVFTAGGAAQIIQNRRAAASPIGPVARPLVGNRETARVAPADDIANLG